MATALVMGILAVATAMFCLWVCGLFDAAPPSPISPTIRTEEYSYEALHVGGDNPCGGVAWVFIENQAGKAMFSSNVVMPNGDHPSPCSPVVCGACGNHPVGVGLRPSQIFKLRQVPRLTPEMITEMKRSVSDGMVSQA